MTPAAAWFHTEPCECYVWLPGSCGGYFGYDTEEMAAFIADRAARPGDFNDDRVTNSLDFFDYLAAFFDEERGAGAEWYRAEWNGDGAIDTLDLFAFLADFFR